MDEDAKLTPTGGASFFRDVTAYPARPWQDPRENRLTAAFASTLRYSPRCANELAAQWVQSPVSEPLAKVVAQRRTGRGIVDIELQFGATGRSPALVIWVEVKHGSGLSGDDQLERYARALREEFPVARTHVVLLAPAAFDAQATNAEVVATWQSVHRCIVLAVLDEGDAVARWLMQQLARYLEEEGLDDVPLTSNTVEALAALTALDSALARVMQIADAKVATEWGPRVRTKKKVRYGLGAGPYAFKPVRRGAPARDWGGARLEWGLDFTDQYPREHVFWAGLASPPDGPLANPENNPWIARHEQSGARLEQGGRHVWLMKTLEPRVLLADDDVVRQGSALASFIVATFVALAAEVPPVS